LTLRVDSYARDSRRIIDTRNESHRLCLTDANGIILIAVRGTVLTGEGGANVDVVAARLILRASRITHGDVSRTSGIGIASAPTQVRI
jgi:hypothetical protein